MTSLLKIKNILTAFFIIIALSIFFYPTSSTGISNQDSSNHDDISTILQEFFKSGDISKIRPLLSEEGRIFLSLDKIKNAKGFFSAHQTLLILREFFQQNNTVSVQIESNQGLGSPPLTLKTSLIVRDKNSKIYALNLHLTLQRQADSWKIKEIKETGS